jgi:predicted nucleic acid-binding protein
VAALAGDLAERHALRANDAIHLASALAARVSDLVFVSWDAELRHAAAKSGLALAPA